MHLSDPKSPEEEGGQDYDDILGFPGDGFKDKEEVVRDMENHQGRDKG